ncbi:hypothetical protein [Halomicrococcus gelatinilyticus]
MSKCGQKRTAPVGVADDNDDADERSTGPASSQAIDEAEPSAGSGEDMNV